MRGEEEREREERREEEEKRGGGDVASLEEGQPREKEQAGEEEIHLPWLREGDGGHT